MRTESATASIAMDASPSESISISGESAMDSRIGVQELDAKELTIERLPSLGPNPKNVALPLPSTLQAQMPEAPDLGKPGLKRRKVQDLELPRVVAEKTVRERSTLAHMPPPIVQKIAIPQLVGTNDESSADFANNPPPQYPAEAVAQRLEGVVHLELEVSAEGKVTGIRVLKSSGHILLDRAASNAVLRWTGKPATRFGRNIASTEVLPIRFRL